MNNTKLLNRLNELCELNKQFFFRNTKKNHILYFDNSFNDDLDINFTKFQMNNNVIDCINNFSLFIELYLPINEFQFEEYENLILILLQYSNKFKNICVKEFYTELLKKYKIFNLHKKYNYNNTKLSINLQSTESHYFRQLLADYLSINIIIFDDKKFDIYPVNLIYSTFNPTIFIYYKNEYYHVKKKITNLSIFYSNHAITYKILKFEINKELIKYCTKKYLKKYSNLIKIRKKKLQLQCKLLSIDIDENMTKTQLIDKLIELQNNFHELLIF